MSEVTLQAIEELMDGVLDKKLKPIKDTLDAHTKTLELLVSQKKVKDDNQTVVNHRLDRLEKWGRKVGKKLDIQLEL